MERETTISRAKSALSRLIVLSLLFAQAPAFVTFDAEAQSTSCQGTPSLSLGAEDISGRLGDSESPTPAILDPAVNCRTGEVVTSIYYKEDASGDPKFADSVDAVTIGCSPLNADGTLGAERAPDFTADFSGNSMPLKEIHCPSGSVAVSVNYIGNEDVGGFSDHTDGVTLNCRSIGPDGLGAFTAQPVDNPDFIGNSRTGPVRSCDHGSVLTGIRTDHFNEAVRGPNHPEDLNDSIAFFTCRPLAVQCLQPDVTVELTEDIDPVDPNQCFTYTAIITNNGNGMATENVVISIDTAKTTLDSVLDGGTNNTSFAQWQNQTVPANSSITRRARVCVNNTARGTINAELNVNGKMDDEDTTITDPGAPDLAISIVDSTDPVLNTAPNNCTTYTVTVDNTGTAAATEDVTLDIDNKMSVGQIFGGGSSNGQRITWTNQNLTVGSHIYRAEACANPNTSGTATAVAGVNGVSSSENTTINTPAPDELDLAVDISVDNSSPDQGDTLTYTLNVQSIAGTADANSVQATLTYDANLQYINDDANCTPIGGRDIRCDFFTMAVPGSPNNTNKNYNLQFTVLGSACPSATIVATANITNSSLNDPNAANNSDQLNIQASCTPTGSPDLSISLFDSLDPIENTAPNNCTTFTVNVDNSGSAAATETVTLDIDSKLSISQAFDGGSVSGQRVTWTNRNLPVGNTLFRAEACALPNQTGIANSIARVENESDDENTTIQDNLICPVGSTASFRLGSEDISGRLGDSESPSPAILDPAVNCAAGDVVTSIHYKEDATNGTFFDSMDAVTIGCSPLNSDGTLGAERPLNLPSDFNGNSRPLISVRCPSGSVAVSVNYKGIESVGGVSDHTDGVTLNCRSIGTTGLGAFTAQPIANPDIDSNSRTGPVRSCDGNSVLTGIRSDHFNEGVRGSNFPEDLNDSIAFYTCRPLIQECNTPQPNLSIDVTDTEDPIENTTPNNCTTYTVTVQNTGGATTETVTLDIDSKMTISQVFDGGNFAGQRATWANQSLTGTHTYRVSACANAGQSGLATATGRVSTLSANETTAINNSGTPVLTIALDDSIDPVNEGQCFDYNVTVTNTGTAPATENVVLSVDNDQLTINQIFNGGSQNGQTITWQNQTIVNGGNITLRANVCARTPSAGTAESTAVVNGTSDMEPTTINAVAADELDIAIGLTIDNTSPDRNDTLTYRLSLQSVNGTADAHSVRATLTYDPNVQYINDDANCAPSGGRNITCDFFTMAVPGSPNNTNKHYDLQFTVLDSACPNATIFANANITNSSLPDPNLGNNSTQVNVNASCTPIGTPDLVLDLHDTLDPIETTAPNNCTTLVVDVLNNGTVAANETVTLNVGSLLTIQNVRDGGTAAGQTVTWSNRTIPVGGAWFHVDVCAAGPTGTTISSAAVGSLSDTETTSIVNDVICPVGQTGTVRLGNTVTSSRIGDGLSPPAHPAVLDPAVNCAAGDVVTSIHYKEDATSTFADSMDAVTVGCSPLNSNGTLGAERPLNLPADFSGNNRPLISVRCPSGSVAVSVNYKGIETVGGVSDHTDGVTLNCRAISGDGLGAFTAQPVANGDIDSNPRVGPVRMCDGNSVLTGIQSDHFPSSRGSNHPEDLNDSIAIYTCREVIEECSNPQPNLSITLADSVDPVDNSGSNTCTIYTATVRNTGAATTEDITIDVDAKMFINRVFDGGTSAGQTATWTNQTLTSTHTYRVEACARANQSGTATATGRVDTLSDAENTTINNVGTPNLSITLTDSLDPIANSGTNTCTTYTVTVQNTGTAAATEDVFLTVDNKLFLNRVFDGGMASGQTVEWDQQSLPIGTTTLRAEACARSGQTGLTSNSARLQNGANDTEPTTINAVGTPNVTVILDDSVDPVTPGQCFLYRTTVTNSGSADAVDVDVSVAVDSKLRVNQVFDGGSNNGQTISYDDIDIAAGTSRVLSAEVCALSTSSGTATSTASATGAPDEFEQTTITATGSPTISINLTDSIDPIQENGCFTYTTAVTNSGNADQDDLDVVLTVDSDLTIQQVLNGGTANGQVITWSDQDIAQGTTLNLLSIVCAKSGAASPVQSTATAGSVNDTEPTTINVSSGTTGGGGGGTDCDISLTVGDDRDPVDIGESITYDIRVRNSGNGSCQTTVRCFLDQDTSFLSATDAGRLRSDDEVIFDDLTLSSGDTETLRTRVRVRPTSRPGDILRFSCTADGDTDGENTRVVSVPFTPPIGGPGVPYPPPYVPPVEPPVVEPVPAIGTLSISKMADRREVQPNSLLTYTITLRNTGGSDIRDITLSDRILQDLVTIDDAGQGLRTGDGLEWTVPLLGRDSTTVIRYRVRVRPGASHGLEIPNTATASSTDLAGPVSDTFNVRVIRSLPQTGVGGFVTQAGQRIAFVKSVQAKPVQRSVPTQSRSTTPEDANLPLTIWLTIIFSGLSIGGLTAQKLLLR